LQFHVTLHANTNRLKETILVSSKRFTYRIELNPAKLIGFPAGYMISHRMAPRNDSAQGQTWGHAVLVG